MRVKEETENYGLKLNIQKTKIMATGQSTSWQIDDGEKVEQRQILLSWATKSMPIMTVAMKLKDDCLLEGKL